jgi:hypothetical protein
MPDRFHELLHRNLQEVFGESNAVRRRAAIEDLYTNDCVLYANRLGTAHPRRCRAVRRRSADHDGSRPSVNRQKYPVAVIA